VLKHFFAMGGYGAYVWSAYAIVCFSLLIQFCAALFRWKKYLRWQHGALKNHE